MEEDKYFYMTTEADSSSSSVGVLRVKTVSSFGVHGAWLCVHLYSPNIHLNHGYIS